MSDGSEPTVDVFFYGLYMDPAALRSRGVEPRSPRPGVADGFSLHIGRLATLVPDPDGRAFGIAYALTHDEIDILYARAGLTMYRMMPLLVQTVRGTVPSLCAVLLDPAEAGPHDASYAASLRQVMTRFSMPAEALSTVKAAG
ncbi:gamma-glutamylcyclotransferase family protein [Micromonospora sp. NPDC051141]|uniref:gamma-glutamylcyclotransferase family protein n=1 Tax=Micromonospora sp. NPDC051141 TaxID=3364284 RepID=UPI0037926985